MPRPTLTRIAWNPTVNTLSLAFADGVQAVLSAEFLRVFSPSAEVRGHGGGEPMLVIGKSQVKLVAVEPVGRYALKLVFDDGHDSGLYDSQTLHQLCQQQATLWQNYRSRLTALGLDHPAPASAVRMIDVLSAAPPQSQTQSPPQSHLKDSPHD